MTSAQDFEIPSVEAMRRNSEQAGALLKTLGNPDRLLILCQINRGEILISIKSGSVEHANCFRHYCLADAVAGHRNNSSFCHIIKGLGK